MSKPGDQLTSSEKIINHLKMTGRFNSVAREVLERTVTVEHARQKGLKISSVELQQAVDLFRQINGLHSAADTTAWLKKYDLSVAAFSQYIEENLLIRKFTDFLEDSTCQDMYISSPEIQGAVSRMMYKDFLAGALA